jgi:ribonuclease-3
MPATDHNERYEYLGDAVLELSISHILMELFPEHAEGELSKLRAAAVNETRLAGVARGLGLGDYLYLGKGEDMTGGRDKPSLLSDAYEAILGAVYLDRGFKKVLGVVKKHFDEVLARADERGFVKDFKTRLQEEAQGQLRAMPRYRLIKETGPDHRKMFEVHLFIKEELMGIGKGGSKKAAEQEAARIALGKLRGES